MVVGKAMVSIVVVVVVVVVDVDVVDDVDDVAGVTAVSVCPCKKIVVPNVSKQANRSNVYNGFRFHQCQNVIDRVNSKFDNVNERSNSIVVVGCCLLLLAATS